MLKAEALAIMCRITVSPEGWRARGFRYGTIPYPIMSAVFDATVVSWGHQERPRRNLFLSDVFSRRIRNEKGRSCQELPRATTPEATLQWRFRELESTRRDHKTRADGWTLCSFPYVHVCVWVRVPREGLLFLRKAPHPSHCAEWTLNVILQTKVCVGIVISLSVVALVTRTHVNIYGCSRPHVVRSQELFLKLWTECSDCLCLSLVRACLLSALDADGTWAVHFTLQMSSNPWWGADENTFKSSSWESLYKRKSRKKGSVLPSADH